LPHLKEFLPRACRCVEEIQLVVIANLPVAFLGNVVIAQRYRSLSQAYKELLLFEFESSVVGNLDVSRSERQVVPLFEVFLEE
jgi:hypothetical protein